MNKKDQIKATEKKKIFEALDSCFLNAVNETKDALPCLKHKGKTIRNILTNVFDIKLDEEEQEILDYIEQEEYKSIDAKIPNKETRKAIEELRTNKNLESFSKEEFYKLMTKI